MAYLIVKKELADNAVAPIKGAADDGAAMPRFYSRSSGKDYLERIIADSVDAGQTGYRLAVVEGLERQALPSGGETWIAREPDVPGFYTKITNISEKDLPADPDNEPIVFEVLDSTTHVCVKRTVLDGRAGLNAWHLDTVGYIPDLEGNGLIAIDELIDNVGVHMIFSVAGLD
jgi:hypothetical protein